MDMTGASHADCLDIAVVGAGIAGLAAGICLRNAGHKVTIYERSEFKNEVGAAINMPPHAVRILRKWGITNPESDNGEQYKDSARGKKLYGSLARDPKTGDIVMMNPFDGDEELYGARATSYHRADLHNALRAAALNAGSLIVLGRTALDVDCEAGTVILTDSASENQRETIKADLVILANGFRSPFVGEVTGQDVPLTQLGLNVYRMLVPVEDLLLDPESAVLFQEEGKHFSTRTLLRETGVFTITYPCREGELMNVAIFAKPRVHDDQPLDWDTTADVADAEAALEGFHPAYKAILKNADIVKVYSLSERAPLSTYVSGRAVLIGDAAHPMLPTVAGGGTTSLEDAAALEVLLKGLKPSNSTKLEQRLALFDALRRPRDSLTQIISKDLLKPRPAIELADQVRDFYTGHLPAVPLAGSSKDTREFIYPYDVYKVTKIALAWAEKESFPDDMLRRIQNEDVIKHFGR